MGNKPSYYIIKDHHGDVVSVGLTNGALPDDARWAAMQDEAVICGWLGDFDHKHIKGRRLTFMNFESLLKRYHYKAHGDIMADPLSDEGRRVLKEEQVLLAQKLYDELQSLIGVDNENT